jgi:hypothetical protein
MVHPTILRGRLWTPPRSLVPYAEQLTGSGASSRSPHPATVLDTGVTGLVRLGRSVAAGIPRADVGFPGVRFVVFGVDVDV